MAKFWGCSSVGRGKLLYNAAGRKIQKTRMQSSGVVAQLVEHLLCKQGVVSSSLISSTRIKRSRKGKNKTERHLLGQPSPSRQFEPDQLHQNKGKKGGNIPFFERKIKYKFAKGGEYIMVKVLVRDNNVEQALRVAKRKSQKEGLYREMKERQRYEKPTTKRKRLKEEAVRNEKKRQSKQRMVFGF